LLDTSASMSGSYREVRDYITGPFLKEYLRFGDTFHIISFSGGPRLEIARRIEGQGDLETVIGRMFLLYPLEPGSDIAGALAYLETYLSQLSPSKPKKVVLVSDGKTVPELPAGGIEDLIGETRKRLAGQKATLDFVSIPLGVLPSSGREAYTPIRPRPAAPLPANPPPSRQPVPPVAASPAPPPEVPARAPPAASAPAPEAGSSPGPAAAPPVEPENQAVLPPPPPSPALPPVVPPLPVSPVSEPEIARQNPQPERRVSGQPAGEAAVPPPSAQKPSFPFILLFLPASVILGSAVFFLNRDLRRSPGRAVTRAANLPVPTKGENTGQPPRLEDRPLMLSLFVEDQNTFIGKRNIHAVKPGLNFTIGGGKSDFLIFLVPMPFRIADLRYQGNSCLLIPRKPEYFPDTGSSPVKDCIGKTVRVVSDKDYELFIRIDLCEDPLAALNRLINAI
jgi:hypothetical protein